MVLRHSRMLGLGVIVAAGPAFGQAPTSTPFPGAAEARPAKHITVAQAAMKPVPAMAVAPPSQPGAPHTLAEALALTYSNQPVLLAERAKLRATDENVPRRCRAGGPPS
jgi:outer membrane protein